MKRLVAVLALAALAGSVGPLQAQVIKVLDYNSTYRYNQVDNVYGTQPTWTSRTFADTSGNWLGAAGLLGGGEPGPVGGFAVNNILTPPSGRNPAYTSAYYFRAHFNYTAGTRAILTFSNHIDDGAVFYLNGVDIQRRVRVAAGAVNHTTGATGTGGEGAIDVFTYVASNLVSGDNVLAVSIHQSGTGSSDILYGSSVWAEVLNAITITQHPQSQSVQANDSVTFNVAVTGTAPQYQWQFNNVNISLATNTSYTIPSVQAANAGAYRVIVSNPVNSVTSQVAQLTVTTDTTPPTMISAAAQDATSAPYYILVRFDERVQSSSAVNTSNYVIRTVGATNVLLNVSNAQVNANLVRLTVSPWTLGSNYILTVNNVADLLGNVIIPNSGIGIAFWQPVIPNYYTAWNYCPGVSLDGQNWTARTYNEYTNDFTHPPYNGPWITTGDTAPFYYDNDTNLEYPWPGSTTLFQGYPCYYFRKRFVLATNANSVGTVRITHQIDDGGVVYLNGVEIYRLNMPGGTPNFNTLATAQRGVTVPLLQSGDILVTNLFPGTNVVAGEMHPSTLTGQNDPGMSFALTMDAALAPSVPQPQFPDLIASATASPTSLPVGSNYTFTIAVTNRGTLTASSVQATNILPAGVTVVSLPAGCANVGGNVVCGIGTLAINAGVTRALTLRPTVAGTLTNRVVVGSTPVDYPTNSNHAQAVVVVEAPLAPDIAVTASVSPASIAVNSNYTFTFVVTNLGNSTAAAVQSTNALPPGVTVVSLPAGCANVSGSIVCGLGSINAGQAVTRALTLKGTTAGSKTNIVVVGSTPADSSTANNRATNIVSVVSGPDLDIALIGSSLSITFQSQVGVSYVTEYKNTLTTPAWTPVITNAGTGGILTYTIPNPGLTVPTRFYRVRLQ